MQLQRLQQQPDNQLKLACMSGMLHTGSMGMGICSARIIGCMLKAALHAQLAGTATCILSKAATTANQTGCASNASLDGKPALMKSQSHITYAQTRTPPCCHRDC